MDIKNEQEIEKKINEKGLNAPRLNPDKIDEVIMSKTFTVLPSGKCMICELTLLNGFTVRGESASVSKENFDEEIGRDISYKDARNKVWQLEGYLLQEKMYLSETGTNNDLTRKCPNCNQMKGISYEGVYQDEYDWHCTNCGHNFKV